MEPNVRVETYTFLPVYSLPTLIFLTSRLGCQLSESGRARALRIQVSIYYYTAKLNLRTDIFRHAEFTLLNSKSPI